MAFWAGSRVLLRRQEEIYLDDLYEICSHEKKVIVDGEERKAGELFEYFYRKCPSDSGSTGPGQK